MHGCSSDDRQAHVSQIKSNIIDTGNKEKGKVMPFFVLAAAFAAAPIPNMNGVYYIQNGNSTDSAAKTKSGFNTNFSSYPALGRPDNSVRWPLLGPVRASGREYGCVYVLCAAGVCARERACVFMLV